MRQIRPYKPAAKNASANRIRERYLHQLGLQRGAGIPLAAPQSNHVVVISGLPSLPEDRAATEHVLECHDFSLSGSKVSRHTQRTGATHSTGENDEDMSDSGSAHHKEDARSQCSRSTLSVSPSLASREAGEELTSMALACPAGLRKMPEPAMPPPTNNGSSILPWRSSSLSKPATVLLDSAEYRCNDHDSVCSEVTHTTAESSITSTLLSRDWGAVPHPSSFQGGESPASAPGVYFQAGHVQVPRGAQGYCPATSSLAHALNRFNIDSDCEASLASTSIVEDHIMDEDDASLDCAASLASLASHASAGSHKRKKIGKTQRLIDRAAAHERKKMRANLVHSQRMHHPVAASGLSSAIAQDLSGSPQSAASSQASTLLHVQHGNARSQASVSYGQPPAPLPPAASGLDLGRTPTASNCSDMRRLAREMGPPGLYLPSMPTGVHISSNRSGGIEAPLGYHPQLASRIPTPPSKLVAQEWAPPSCTGSASISKPSLVHADAMSAEGPATASLEHTNYEPATEDDVMEVAMTLSRLGGMRDRPGPIPRIR